MSTSLLLYYRCIVILVYSSLLWKSSSSSPSLSLSHRRCCIDVVVVDDVVVVVVVVVVGLSSSLLMSLYIYYITRSKKHWWECVRPKYVHQTIPQGLNHYHHHVTLEYWDPNVDMMIYSANEQWRVILTNIHKSTNDKAKSKIAALVSTGKSDMKWVRTTEGRPYVRSILKTWWR